MLSIDSYIEGTNKFGISNFRSELGNWLSLAFSYSKTVTGCNMTFAKLAFYYANLGHFPLAVVIGQV